MFKLFEILILKIRKYIGNTINITLLVRKIKRKKDNDIFDKLRNRTTVAKETGATIGKIALERGGEISKQLSKQGKEKLEMGIATAKKAASSKKETIDLIEKLGKLKASGILTDKEFELKKTELLQRL